MIQLPYTPTNVQHRQGGKVTKITGIKIQMEKPRGGYSRDHWYFVGAVEWFDGSGKGREDHPVDMPVLCSDTDAGMAEINALRSLMSDYLMKHGEWCWGKPHAGWYAHRKATA